MQRDGGSGPHAPSTNKQPQHKNVWQTRNNFLEDLSLCRRDEERRIKDLRGEKVGRMAWERERKIRLQEKNEQKGGKREVEIRTVGLGGKISVSLPMKSSRQLGTNPKATTCLFEDTQRSLFSIYPSITVHTQTLQRSGPWDCWLKIPLTQQLLNCINKMHNTYSHYASKSVQRAGKWRYEGALLAS